MNSNNPSNPPAISSSATLSNPAVDLANKNSAARKSPFASPRVGVGKRKGLRWIRYLLAFVWFGFTVSLTVWWVIFGLEQIDSLMTLQHENSDVLVRHQKMLLWEGGTLILSLALGGLALAYYMVRERRESEQVQRFLATFTHELKTPLASLRLQAEALQDSLSDEAGRTLLARLVADTARLTLQLDNSLFLADAARRSGPQRLRIESLPLARFVTGLQLQWPTIKIVQIGDAVLSVDERALDGIFRNLIHNAIVHGRASEVQIECAQASESEDLVSIRVKNNGAAFSGDPTRLGKLFERFYPKSGSGIGLYLVSSLTVSMGGSVRVAPTERGFSVELKLPGKLSPQTGNTGPREGES